MPVYFIGESENFCRSIKIGVAKNIASRQRNLQTGNRLQLKLIGWIENPNPFLLENKLHELFKKFHERGEWYAIEPADILPLLIRAGANGFVAKTSDSFQVLGYDKDAIPEYLGVWEWGTLELEECCPFCGCMCGMHYNDSLMMYHCIHCDELTDFSVEDDDEDDQEL